jgi:hypothetical protein
MTDINQQLADSQMLKHVLDTLLRIEKRLDDHIDDENLKFDDLKDRISDMREELAGSRIKWATLTSVVALVVSGAAAWVFNHLSK